MPASTTLKLSTLAYVILYVRDMKKATAFYRDKLGMSVKVDSPEWVELDAGTTTIALHLTDSAPQPHPAQPALVFAVDDVYAAAAQLKSAGVVLREEPRQVCDEGDKIGVSADIEDLDGNLLSIYSLVAKA